MFRLELKRAFNYKWVFALIVCILSGIGGLIVYHMEGQFRAPQYTSAYEAWLFCLSVAECSIYRLIFPLLIAFPYISTFYSDRHSPFIHLVVIRNGYKQYIILKLLVAFISTAAMVLLTLGLWFVLSVAIYPLKEFVPDYMYQVRGAFSSIYMDMPVLYIALVTFINIVTASCFVLISFVFSFFVKSKAQAMSLPFLLYWGCGILSQFTSRILDPTVLVSPLEWEFSSIKYISVGWLIIIVLSLIGICLFYRKDRKEIF